MASSCRFAFAIHILAVLALKREGGVTSDCLAASVNTNPVVIRRVVSTLRRAGLVCCAQGAGGGATLCRAPESIGLDEVYRAVEPLTAFSGHPHQPDLRCPVGRQIKVVLEEIHASAHQAFAAALAERTLAEVVAMLTESPRPPRRSRKAA
ncbi:MAG: hypothetical protein QOE70_5049 [Chthoniobacter sp.]|jgi:Rrf2 family protein|nr:hypothetical protein [Chthoniobacter sp.]